MISYLQGKVISKNDREITLLTAGGVGYQILVSRAAGARSAVGDEVGLECYLVVREDALLLFGFSGIPEKELFKNFLTVSGVGPKTALNLLALGSVEETTLAIGRGDVEYLTKVSGIGKKTAERIVVELRAKVMEHDTYNIDHNDRPNDAVGDVVSALITLGYSGLDARSVIQKLDTKNKSTEIILREALRSLSK